MTGIQGLGEIREQEPQDLGFHDEIDPFMMQNRNMPSGQPDEIRLQEAKKYMGVQDTVGQRMWFNEE